LNAMQQTSIKERDWWNYPKTKARTGVDVV